MRTWLKTHRSQQRTVISFDSGLRVAPFTSFPSSPRTHTWEPALVYAPPDPNAAIPYAVGSAGMLGYALLFVPSVVSSCRTAFAFGVPACRQPSYTDLPRVCRWEASSPLGPDTCGSYGLSCGVRHISVIKSAIGMSYLRLVYQMWAKSCYKRWHDFHLGDTRICRAPYSKRQVSLAPCIWTRLPPLSRLSAFLFPILRFVGHTNPGNINGAVCHKQAWSFVVTPMVWTACPHVDCVVVPSGGGATLPSTSLRSNVRFSQDIVHLLLQLRLALLHRPVHPLFRRVCPQAPRYCHPLTSRMLSRLRPPSSRQPLS